MTAALECYLYSILEIAETIEAISPEIALRRSVSP